MHGANGVCSGEKDLMTALSPSRQGGDGILRNCLGFSPLSPRGRGPG